jgi:methyl-accepting chemotaxis protein
MEEIVTSVKRVTDIMAEISAASQEQSHGIDQVNTAVSQMDKMTQQNAALVEQAAAAAKSMEEQTDELSRIVAAFQTGATAGRSTQAAQRHPAASRPAKAAAPRPAQQKLSAPRQSAAVEAEDDWKEF